MKDVSAMTSRPLPGVPNSRPTSNGPRPRDRAPDTRLPASREMIDVERGRVLEIRSTGTVPHEVIDEVLSMLDVEESMLDHSSAERERVRGADATAFEGERVRQKVQVGDLTVECHAERHQALSEGTSVRLTIPPAQVRLVPEAEGERRTERQPEPAAA